MSMNNKVLKVAALQPFTEETFVLFPIDKVVVIDTALPGAPLLHLDQMKNGKLRVTIHMSIMSQFPNLFEEKAKGS